MIRVTVWSEFWLSCKAPTALAVYPEGHHTVIRDFLSEAPDIEATAVTMDMEHQGLSDELLNDTDVLIWWGHCRHDFVSDELVERIAQRVYAGMGLILLHSSHLSKVFKRVVGASGLLCWSEKGERERLWVASPGHPIAEGIGEYIELAEEEMYGEPFGIPAPDETVFNCWYEGGRVFRGGVTFSRGAGKVFYFQPGHEEYPTFYHPQIRRVLINAVRWAYVPGSHTPGGCPCVLPLENLSPQLAQDLKQSDTKLR